jgi:hypothetical protein
MLRFFISPHPTFGSYANPIKFKVYASPYFWWWYALTLNEDYRKICQHYDKSAPKLDTHTEREIVMRRVFSDFGDVRYEGCRYKAFAKWWTNRVNTNETRGVYLFAEPYDDTKVEIINDAEEVSTALSDVNSLLLSIPLNLKRKYIDKDINRILKKRQTSAKGRTVRNPKLSKARYSLSKPCVPNALKKAFDVYDAKLQAKQRGEKVGNFEIGIRAKLVYSERAKADEVQSEANRRRTISILVSRHISNVKRMIYNAGLGIFS